MPGHTRPFASGVLACSVSGSSSSLVLAVGQGRSGSRSGSQSLSQSVSQSLSDRQPAQPVWGGEHPPAVASLSLSLGLVIVTIIVVGLSACPHLSTRTTTTTFAFLSTSSDPRYTLGRLLHRSEGWIDEKISRMEQTVAHHLRHHQYPQTV